MPWKRRNRCGKCGTKMLWYENPGRWVCPRENEHTATDARYTETVRKPATDQPDGRGGPRTGSGRRQEPHYCGICNTEMTRVKSTRGYNFRCPNVANHPPKEGPRRRPGPKGPRKK